MKRLHLSILLLFLVNIAYSQNNISRDQNTGLWSDGFTWTTGDPNYGFGETIEINGYVTRENGLTLIANDVDIVDTLVIEGDILFTLNSDLTVQSGGVVIVLGNVLGLGGTSSLIVDGTFIVTGALITIGSPIDAPDPGQVYVYGPFFDPFGTGSGNISDDTIPPAPFDSFVNDAACRTAAPVEAPIFNPVRPTTRCMGANSVTYSATAVNSFSIAYALDAASLAAGNIIDNATGQVDWDAAWTGTSTITTSASGCGGPLSTDFVVATYGTPAASGAISGTASVCDGTSGVSYSVGPIAGASTYIWNYSGTGATINGATNNITIDFTAGATSGNLTVFGRNTCADGAVSPNFAITINPTPAAPTGTSPQNFCAIDNPTVADLAATGTTIQWYAAATGGAPLGAGTALADATIYYASQTVAGCESDSRLPVTVAIADPAAPTGTSPQNFCAIDNPTVADLAATGTTIQWYAAATGGAPLGAGTALADATIYYASQTIAGCESDSRLPVTVAIADPAAPTGASPQNFCAIDNPTVADLAATGTTIQWYAAATGGAPLGAGTALADATIYYASQTVAGCESDSRLPVTVAIADPAAPTGTSPQNFCAIDNPTVADLAATGTTIQWYAAATGGAPLGAGTALADATIYYASQTVAGCESDSRLPVTVAIADPAAPTGTSPQNFCAIDNPTVADLAATGTTIQWYAAATGGAPLGAGTALADATIYYASQTVAGCESDSRLPVTVAIADPAAPTGTSPQNFCAIDNPTVADLAATGTTIQWYAAATGGAPLGAGTALADATIYYASQTVAGCESDSRLPVTVAIADPAAPTGASPQNFCAIDNPTVADLAATGTTIQWYAAATGGAPLGAGTALADATIYYASQTVAGCESDSRLPVTVAIADPAAPTGTSPQNFCAIDNPTVADLAATGTTIQWYAAATGGAPLGAGTALADATIYYASQTVAGCESDSRLPVTVAIADPAAPTGTSPQNFCAIDNPTVADLAATGTTIQWYAAATGGAPLGAGTALADATIYYASQTVAGCESDSRLPVTVAIADPAAPTGTSPQNFCAIDNPTVADLAATGTTIQWYAAATGGAPLGAGTALADATIYYASQTVAGCESDSRLPVTVAIADPAAPTGTSPQNFCAIDNPTVADLAATGTTIQWYAAATGGAPLGAGTALADATIYYASQTVAGCESDSRLPVTVAIADPAAPTGTSPQNFCAIDNPTVADLAATGTTIQWYAAATGGAPLGAGTALADATIYYASQTVAGCESDSRLPVTVAIADPAAPTGTSPQNFCAIDNPTVADLAATGTTIQWYAAATGGAPLGAGTALADATIYYASQTVAGCESDSRLPVTVAIADPAAPTGASPQNFCAIDNPTVADLAATGTTIQWYAAATGGAPLGAGTALADATIYYASQTVAGCESDSRLPVTVAIADPAAPTGTSPQNFCAIDNPTVADLAATGTTIQWYAAATGGAPLGAGTALADATIYYASQTVAGCESDSRLPVTVAIADPAAPTGTSPQNFCAIDNPTVADLAATGTTIQWYAAATGGAPLGAGTALADATIYYASQTVAGCESDSRLPVTVAIADPAAPTGTSPQNFCAIDNPTVADLAATGTTIQWYAAATGGAPLGAGTALADATIYYASQTVAGCESDSRLPVTVAIADPAAPTGTSPQNFCAIDNPTVADLAATGTTIQWYAAATGGAPLGAGTALADATIYYASQTVAGCESDSRLPVTVAIADPAAPTGTSPQNFCAIDNPTVADLAATGTTIQWYAAATGGAPLGAGTALADATIYYASQTVAGCESDSRLPVTVAIADPAAPTGTSPQNFCAIDNPTVADLAATGTTIQWYAAATGGAPLGAGTALADATIYYASQTVAGCESDSRLPVTVAIADPAAPTGTSPQNFCAIDNPTVADLAATGTTIQWYAAATGGAPLGAGTALADATIYYASQTVAGCESDSRLPVTVAIADPAAPTGTSPQNFCAIDNPTVADLAATGTTIQWYAAATGGAPLGAGTALADATIYYASQTVAGCESDSRLPVTVAIADPAAPTGTSPQNFCAIDNPTVADLAATGTTIQWYAAATGGAPLGAGTALADATIYYASQTVAGCESDSRLPVTVAIADPAAPTGTSPQNFCAIDNPTVADLAATGTTIQWYAAATGGAPLGAGTALADATIYYASQTVAGCESDSRLPVTVAIADPAAPTGTSPQNFCAIDNPTVADLAATGTTIQWYAAATGGAPLGAGTALADATIYYASQTVAGCESDSRLPVTVAIADPAAPTGTSPQNFCAIDNPTVADLAATGTTIQWYAAATGGAPLGAGTALADATIYYASQTVAGCESDSRLPVTVAIADPAAPTGTSPQNFCAIDNPTVADLAATGTTIQWYAAATGGAPLGAGTALADATIYYASQTVAGCESDSRLPVTVAIADPAAPTGTSPQNFCAIDNPTVADLAATGTTIQWYAAATGGAPLGAGTALADATIYYASQTVAGCESDSRLPVTVAIADPAAPTGTSPQNFCAIDNPTVADLAATGTTIQWYAAATGGAPLGAGTALADATIYYASQTVAGCESDSRLPVTVAIADPAAPTGASPQNFCAIDNPTVADLAATGTTIQWYAAATGGAPLGAGTALADATIYYASQTVAGCESDSRLPVTVAITPTVGTPVFAAGATSTRCQATGSVTYTANATNSIGITYSLDAASITGGNSIVAGTGQVTYAAAWSGTSIITASASGCNETASADHVVTINPLPATSDIAGEQQPSCFASGQVYSVSNTPGSTYLWTVPSDATIITSTGNSITVDFGSVSGDISVTETNVNGCIGETKTYEINLLGCELIADFDVNKTTSCLGDTIIVTNVSSGTSSSSTYNWDFGANAVPAATSGPGPHEIVYTSAGTKTIELTVQEGVIDITSKTLEVIAIPQILFSTNDRCGSGTVLFTATTSDGDAVDFSLDGISVDETDNSSPYEFSRDINEDESLTVWARALVSAYGCQGDWTQATAYAYPQPVTGEINVDSPNPANTEYLDIACRNSSRTYFVSGNTGSVYRWQIPSLSIDVTGSESIEVSWSVQEDEYVIQVQEISDLGCEGTIREGTVLVADPQVSLGPDQEVCIGESATFTPDAVFDGYLWHNGSTGEEYTGNSTETVSIRVTDSYGCTDTDSAELIVYENPVLSLGIDTAICNQDGYVLYGGNYYSYLWSTGETTSSIIVYPGQGLISLTVWNIHNCQAEDEIEILACDAEKLFESISNAFTPNGDGVHDTWVINNIEVYPQTTIQVYDKAGRIVFSVDGGYENDWDGTSNGKQLPMDTYYYLIDFNSSDISPKQGTVTIVR